MQTTKQQRDAVKRYLLEKDIDQLARECVFSAFDDLDAYDAKYKAEVLRKRGHYHRS